MKRTRENLPKMWARDKRQQGGVLACLQKFFNLIITPFDRMI